jgi:tetratricopeptide (TPR) repeat protein
MEGLGLLLERRDHPEEALELYRRAEEILSDELPTLRVDAVAGEARCFHSLGDVRYEIHILESLLATIRRAGLIDPNALARLHAALVFAYVEAGLYGKAGESAAELEAIAPTVTDPLRIAQMHLHVARVYLVRGDIETAEQSLQRAEDAYRQVQLKAAASLPQREAHRGRSEAGLVPPVVFRVMLDVPARPKPDPIVGWSSTPPNGISHLHGAHRLDEVPFRYGEHRGEPL